jgi:hypothetical protein
MPVVRHLKNKAGAEGILVGLTEQDWQRLETEGMFQVDVRRFLTGVASIVVIRGKDDAQIMRIVDADHTHHILPGLPPRGN